MFDGVCCVYFFFFKQKTAYEMRISDWSSDVCSSDLFARPVTRKRPGESLDSNRTPSAKRGAIYSEKELQMLESVKIQRRQSEIRSALSELVGKDKPTEDETRSMDTLDAEYRQNEVRYRDALSAPDTERRHAGEEPGTRGDRQQANLHR